MPLPFRSPTSAAAFFADCPAGVAERKLSYVVDEGLEAAVLVGAPGLGKTTVIRRLADRTRQDRHAVVDVFFPHLDVDGLVAFLDAELTGAADAATRDVRLRRIADRARELAREGRGILILVDDAHLLNDGDIFDALHGILNLRGYEGARVTVILAGQPPLLGRVSQASAFSQRIAATATLAPLSEVETASYVRHRLRTAGQEEDLFEEEALAAVYEAAGGVPRVIDRVCEMATIVAASERRSRVCAADVRAVANELTAPAWDAA